MALVFFTLGSALCATATSVQELVLFRILQGIGGGMIMPVGQLIMAQVAGPKRMGRVMGASSRCRRCSARSSARSSVA